MMSDMTTGLFAATFPGAAQQPNLLPPGSGGGGGRGLGGGRGDGRGGVDIIGSGAGVSGFVQQPQFDERGVPQQQQQSGGGGGSSSFGGGGGRGGADGGGGEGSGEGRLDLSGYRRLAKPKPEPANESEIIVGNTGNIRTYVEQATELLTRGLSGRGDTGPGGEQQQQPTGPLDRIYIKGGSQGMANAIIVAEGVRRIVPNLHMIVRTQAEEVLDDWVLTPAAEEERRTAESEGRGDLMPLSLQVPRTVHYLILILAKHVREEELRDVGYQAPLDPDQTSSADFLQDAEKRLYGGRRGGDGGGRRGRGRGDWRRGWRGGYRGGRGRRGRGEGEYLGDPVGGTKREDLAQF